MAKCLFSNGSASAEKTTTINVYGGAYETITLGNYTTLTNENGLGTMEVKESDVGKSFTPSCSVSGYDTEVTLSADTYCMPSGALYWYGFIETAISGGMVSYKFYSADGNDVVTQNVNCLTSTAIVNDAIRNASAKNKIDVTNYNTLYVIYDGTANNEGLGRGLASNIPLGENRVNYAAAKPTTKATYSLDISSYSGSYYVTYMNDGSSKTHTINCYALWLE